MGRLSRRQLLGGALGSVAAAAWPARAQAEVSRVASVRHGDAWVGDHWTDADLDRAAVRLQVERALSLLTGASSGVAAVERLIPAVTDPGQRYAIKVNCVNEDLPSHPAVVFAVADLLVEAGARAENIVVFDRIDHELMDAGFAVNLGAGVQVHGSARDGVGHGAECALTHGTVRLSRVVESADHLINVPVLKNHEMAGVTLALKNHFGSIDRPERLHGPGGACSPGIVELNRLAAIRDKTRLVLADALFATVVSGLAGRPDVAPMTLIASADPVAADAVGLALINTERARAGHDAIAAPHIAEAARAGLGTDTLLERIELELSPVTSKPKPWESGGCACAAAPVAWTTAAALALARRR